MPQDRSRRGSPDTFDFEGSGDEARAWLDGAFGAQMRMTGPFGTVHHHREDHGSVAFDHIRVDAEFVFDADAMPALVVTDVIGGSLSYSRDGRTDAVRDGDTVMASGWEMPFAGASRGYEIRTTSVSAGLLADAVAEVDPDFRWDRLQFDSFVPHSAAAGARWRASIDQLSATFPDDVSALAHREASRLLGHTLLRTFPNDLVHSGGRLALDRDARDATPSAVRRAVRVIEERAGDDLSLSALADACSISPRALQYAFRRELGCTPRTTSVACGSTSSVSCCATVVPRR